MRGSHPQLRRCARSGRFSALTLSRARTALEEFGFVVIRDAMDTARVAGLRREFVGSAGRAARRHRVSQAPPPRSPRPRAASSDTRVRVSADPPAGVGSDGERAEISGSERAARQRRPRYLRYM